MSVESVRRVAIELTGDVTLAHTYGAVNNLASPGVVDLIDLAIGPNTIVPPIGAVACTIIPPAGNAINITLKGIAGDTGIVIHNTDPTSIALFDASSTFELDATAAITGVRLIWT